MRKIRPESYGDKIKRLIAEIRKLPPKEQLKYAVKTNEVLPRINFYVDYDQPKGE